MFMQKKKAAERWGGFVCPHTPIIIRKEIGTHD